MINSVSKEYLLNQVKLSAAVFGWNRSHVRYISLVSYVGVQILFNIYVGNKLLFLFMSRTEPFSFPFSFFFEWKPSKMYLYIWWQTSTFIETLLFVHIIFNRSVIIRYCCEKFSYLSLLEMKRDNLEFSEWVTNLSSTIILLLECTL